MDVRKKVDRKKEIALFGAGQAQLRCYIKSHLIRTYTIHTQTEHTHINKYIHILNASILSISLSLLYLVFFYFLPIFPFFFFGCILCLSTKGLTEQNSTCCLHHPYIHNLYVLTRLNRANSFNIHILGVSNVGHPGDACAAHRTRSIIAAKCPDTCATGAGRAPCV